MADWLVPLSDVRFSAEEVDAVAEVYRSGWLSQGPRVASFERAFAAHLGSGHAIAVSSGTAALALICAALDLRPGDEVIVPSLTFAATAAVVVHAGARPVFAEIAGTMAPWLDPRAVREAITPRTRAIITVGYGGHPGALVELRGLADERGVALIEDAAHTLGASIEGRPAGTVGDAGAFSFFANKNLALGEGGMIVTDRAELAERLRLLRSHGLSADTWARHRGGDAGYDVLEPGFNYRLDEPRAALGELLLTRLDHGQERRAELAQAYAAGLEGAAGVEPVLREAPGVRCAWHIYPVLLEPGRDRGAFRTALARERVQTSIHYPPLHGTRAFAGGATSLPRTEDYGRRTVTLPLFAHMADGQQAHVLQAVQSALRTRVDATSRRK